MLPKRHYHNFWNNKNIEHNYIIIPGILKKLNFNLFNRGKLLYRDKTSQIQIVCIKKHVY